jgi:hypothetical protein
VTPGCSPCEYTTTYQATANTSQERKKEAAKPRKMMDQERSIMEVKKSLRNLCWTVSSSALLQQTTFLRFPPVLLPERVDPAVLADEPVPLGERVHHAKHSRCLLWKHAPPSGGLAQTQVP